MKCNKCCSDFTELSTLLYFIALMRTDNREAKTISGRHTHIHTISRTHTQTSDKIPTKTWLILHKHTAFHSERLLFVIQKWNFFLKCVTTKWQSLWQFLCARYTPKIYVHNIFSERKSLRTQFNCRCVWMHSILFHLNCFTHFNCACQISRKPKIFASIFDARNEWKHHRNLFNDSPANWSSV